jgi:hypothetical protein
LQQPAQEGRTYISFWCSDQQDLGSATDAQEGMGMVGKKRLTLVLMNRAGQELCKLSLQTRGLSVVEAMGWGFNVHLPMITRIRQGLHHEQYPASIGLL